MKNNIIIQKQNYQNYSHLITSGINPLLARVLYNRNIKTMEEANKFLFSTLEDLPSAYEIKDIQKVYDVISESIDNSEIIAVFGDYDCDGITGTSILVGFLQDMCAKYIWRLPDRLNEGYGISKIAIRELYEKGVKLIITIDNGIVANEEIQLAKDLGMKVIVLDHHTPSKTLPNADAIIDLHIPGETFPFIELCGAGLAFFVVCFLYEEFGFGYEEGYKFLDLAAIGTVGDVMPLVDVNRIIVREGLKIINSKEYSRIGVLTLINLFELEQGDIVAMDIGFKLGPAINAPGRLYVNGANISLQLLLCTNQQEAIYYSTQMIAINEQRKSITEISLKKAKEYLIKHNLLENKILVLFIKDVPEGVVGLVSGKLTEQYNKPSIVFTEGKDCYKASARSIPEYHLLNGLRTCDDLFTKYGGHKQAAGMSIKKDENILKELRKRLNQHADAVLTEKDLIKKIYVEEIISEDKLSLDFVRNLNLLEPCGMCNPKPNFLIKNYFCKKKKVIIKKKNIDEDNKEINEEKVPKSLWQTYSFLGKEQTHLKLFGKKSEALGFNLVDEFVAMNYPRELQLVFTLDINKYMNRKTVQLHIIDMDFPKKAIKNNINNNRNNELTNKLNDAIANLQFITK